MFKNWKKSAVIALAALTLTGGVAVPSFAHGHGYGHHNAYRQSNCYNGTCDYPRQNCDKDCDYPGQNCDRTCDYHGRNCDGTCEYSRQNYNQTKTSQKKNVKQKGYYCEYHDKTHKKKSSCKNYCKKHKTIHANGKRHRVVKNKVTK